MWISSELFMLLHGVFFICTQGWRSGEIEAARGHSSVLFDGRLNPWQESRDAGEDCVVLLAATLSESFADDANKNVGSFVVHYCQRPTTVTLGYHEI